VISSDFCSMCSTHWLASCAIAALHDSGAEQFALLTTAASASVAARSLTTPFDPPLRRCRGQWFSVLIKAGFAKFFFSCVQTCFTDVHDCLLLAHSAFASQTHTSEASAHALPVRTTTELSDIAWAHVRRSAQAQARRPWLPRTRRMSVHPLPYLRLTGSNCATTDTAPKIKNRMVPPATTDKSRFLREGVTAASAARGDASIAPAAVVTPAVIFSCVLQARQVCSAKRATHAYAIAPGALS
jgi:hypothetical protein